MKNLGSGLKNIEREKVVGPTFLVLQLMGPSINGDTMRCGVEGVRGKICGAINGWPLRRSKITIRIPSISNF